MHALSIFLYTLMGLLAVFIILIVLVQRGKGGGLAGAFGGAGGSSAFGTKAGDLFMKVTLVASIFWMLIAMMLIKISNQDTVALPTSVPFKGGAGPGTSGVMAPPTTGHERPGTAPNPAGRAPAAGRTAPTGPPTPIAPGSTPH